MKFTTLGVSGSGKTAYIYSLINLLTAKRAAKGFCVCPECNTEESIGRLKSVAEFESNSIGKTGEWHPGTEDFISWKFSFEKDRNIVTGFRWVDYRGAAISDVFRHNKVGDEIDRIFSHIIDSNAVIITCDSFLLTYYTERLDAARMHTGADDIHILLDNFSKICPNRELIVVLMLTKADTVEKKWSADNYRLLKDRALDVFDRLKTMISENNWKGGIVPISVIGARNVKTTVLQPDNFRHPVTTNNEIIDIPEPQNVEHALYYCIGHTLLQMKNIAIESIDNWERQLEIAIKKTGFVDSIVSTFKRKDSAKAIANELRNRLEQDVKDLSSFEGFVDPLIIEAKNFVEEIQ